MDWNVVLQFIPTDLLIMVVGCYCLGMFLKAIPNIPDWTIPLLLLGITCVLTTISIGLESGFNGRTILDGFIYGLLSSAVAVYGNQVIKQIKKG